MGRRSVLSLISASWKLVTHRDAAKCFELEEGELLGEDVGLDTVEGERDFLGGGQFVGLVNGQVAQPLIRRPARHEHTVHQYVTISYVRVFQVSLTRLKRR